MDKLTIATQVLLKLIETNKTGFDTEGISGYAWEIADAMQAEAEKRKKAEAAQKRKEIREMLNAPNTFVEREGQHFDDVADIQKPYTSSEWQPDWNQAPAWANWWAMDMDLWQAHWYEVEPIADAIAWRRRTRTCKQAPSFDYQGNWKESLRKRPQ